MRSHIVRRTALAVAVGAASLAGPGLVARAQDVSPLHSHRERELAREGRVEQGRSIGLQLQGRYAQDRYRQDYRNRLREERRASGDWHPYDYERDAYFDAPASVRYTYDGRSYDTNAFGADALRDAANDGYEEGVRSGEADREDGWRRGGYRDSYAYQDGDRGYDGRELDPSQHDHYFREGVERGYEDGFNDRRRYGRTDEGHYLLSASVLSGILTFEPIP
jgi:hypothetical protein